MPKIITVKNIRRVERKQQAEETRLRIINNGKTMRNLRYLMYVGNCLVWMNALTWLHQIDFVLLYALATIIMQLTCYQVLRHLITLTSCDFNVDPPIGVVAIKEFIRISSITLVLTLYSKWFYVGVLISILRAYLRMFISLG